MLRRLTRFSIRALLVVVTLLCVVLGYGANWKYQREAFLEQHQQLLKMQQLLPDSFGRMPKLSFEPRPLPGNKHVSTPHIHLLRLVRARLYDYVPIAVPEHDVLRIQRIWDSDYSLVAETQSDYRRARQLFPEAFIGCETFVRGRRVPAMVLDAEMRKMGYSETTHGVGK
jgi:hypothetical protein